MTSSMEYMAKASAITAQPSKSTTALDTSSRASWSADGLQTQGAPDKSQLLCLLEVPLSACSSLLRCQAAAHADGKMLIQTSSTDMYEQHLHYHTMMIIGHIVNPNQTIQQTRVSQHFCGHSCGLVWGGVHMCMCMHSGTDVVC